MCRHCWRCSNGATDLSAMQIGVHAREQLSEGLGSAEARPRQLARRACELASQLVGYQATLRSYNDDTRWTTAI